MAKLQVSCEEEPSCGVLWQANLQLASAQSCAMMTVPPLLRFCASDLLHLISSVVKSAHACPGWHAACPGLTDTLQVQQVTYASKEVSTDKLLEAVEDCGFDATLISAPNERSVTQVSTQGSTGPS